ncbi:MAG: hypothetical protein QXY36_01535 [Sulfolobales archaeon]
MRIEITTPLSGRIVKELTINEKVRLSDIVKLIISDLGININYSDLESYYLVAVNGNQLGEGVKWDEVFLTNDDYVVILPLAFGGSTLLG